jgi:uncharacterized membrane protein
MKKTIFTLLISLILFSTYLAVAEHYSSTVCLLGSDNSDCKIVQNSKYGKVLGFKVSTIGPIAISILFLTFMLSLKKSKYKQNFKELFYLFLIIGTASSLYFIFLQIFILKQICSTCIIIDISIIAVALLSYRDYKISKKRRWSSG